MKNILYLTFFFLTNCLNAQTMRQTVCLDQTNFYKIAAYIEMQQQTFGKELKFAFVGSYEIKSGEFEKRRIYRADEVEKDNSGMVDIETTDFTLTLCMNKTDMLFATYESILIYSGLACFRKADFLKRSSR